jgi:hypothetical protein
MSNPRYHPELMEKRRWRGIGGGVLVSVLVALGGCAGTKARDDGVASSNSGASGDDGSEGGGRAGATGGVGGGAGASGGASAGGSAGGGALGGGAGSGEMNRGGASGVAGAGAGEGGNGASVGSGGATAGTTGNGGAGGSAGTGADCKRTLLLMVDTSGSMDMRLEGETVTRWEMLMTVLLDLVAQIPEAAHVGMLGYPNMQGLGVDPPQCFDPSAFVPIAPNEANQQTAMTTLVENVFPDGGAATHAAYRHALQTLEEQPPGREPVVVLITDGAPTYSVECIGSGNSEEPADVAPLLAEVAQARSDGIRTLSVGWFEAEVDHPWLSALAVEGGTAESGCATDRCHVVAGESEPYAALERILAYAKCAE